MPTYNAALAFLTAIPEGIRQTDGQFPGQTRSYRTARPMYMDCAADHPSKHIARENEAG